MKRQRNTRWKGENHLLGLHNTTVVRAQPFGIGLQKYGNSASQPLQFTEHGGLLLSHTGSEENIDPQNLMLVLTFFRLGRNRFTHILKQRV